MIVVGIELELERLLLVLLGRLAGCLKSDVGLTVDGLRVDEAKVDPVTIAVVNVAVHLIDRSLGSGDMDGCNLFVLEAFGLGGKVSHEGVGAFGKVPDSRLTLKEFVQRLFVLGWVRELASELFGHDGRPGAVELDVGVLDTTIDTSDGARMDGNSIFGSCQMVNSAANRNTKSPAGGRRIPDDVKRD